MYQKCYIAKDMMFGSPLHSWARKLQYLQAPKTAVSLRAIQGATSLGYWKPNAVIPQRPLIPDSDDGQRRQERLNDDTARGISRHSRLELRHDRSTVRPFSSFLTDSYSRQHNYLRISVTERCNLRCLYCMPEEGVPLSPPAHILTTPEIVYLSELFVGQGVNKIRLTGGEPTVRKDIVDLMRQIGQLRSSGLKELCLTTNGISLHRKLDSMVESGLTGVNLSLDTLDPFQFTLMTRRNGHGAVLTSINRILEMNKLGAGVKLKINCVVMRGLNEREIIPFVEMGKEQDLEVRFIEYMPFDGNKWSEGKMLPFMEMLALIRQKYPDVYKVQDHPNDTSKTYRIPGFTGRIGFITSMTHNFCGTCNRLRITSDGNLKVCLFGNSEVSLRDILREHNDGKPIDQEAMEAIRQVEMDRQQRRPGSTGALGVSDREARLLHVIGMAVKRKKKQHAGIGELEYSANRPMILIGG
jgi:GTP 3',8-cyclase